MRNQRRRRLCGAPGQQSPAVVALCWPKASARELHQRNAGSIVSLSGGLRSGQPTETRKPSTLRIGSIEGSGRFLRSQLRRIGLGHPSRARLRAGPQQCSMGLQWSRSKPELSTLLGTGTFYFAVTPPGRLRKDLVRREGRPGGFLVGARHGAPVPGAGRTCARRAARTSPATTSRMRGVGHARARRAAPLPWMVAIVLIAGSPPIPLAAR